MSKINTTGKKVLKLIAIDQLQYNRLRQYGRTPESFNDIVKKLLNEVEERKRMNNVTTLEQETPLSN
jgi:hypothetical protein